MPDIPAPAIVALSLVFGYLCGSIPFGLILARLGGAGDVRAIGSGNIGATNVLRTGRKGLAAATLLGDALKGTLAVIIASAFAFLTPIPAALGAFLGHLFPVWLGFKGGKGIATYVGLLIAFSWQALLAFAIIWLGVAAITRYSSLAALLATLATPVVFYLLDRPHEALLFAALTALGWFMHRANIARLLSGQESRIGSRG